MNAASDKTTPEAPQLLSDVDRVTLLQTAAASISYGLTHRVPSPITLSQFAPTLHVERATFVTLRIGEQLRGCIGSLYARRPLVTDVTENAFSAAFRDKRFSPLTAEEFAQLNYHISVLHPPQVIHAASRADLITQLRPGIDGLILEEAKANKRATFLPDVWETLGQPEQFLSQLMKKGGWPDHDWPTDLKISRYTTEGFG
jgi:uncharacterized protein